jgi:hypothetical protein
MEPYINKEEKKNSSCALFGRLGSDLTELLRFWGESVPSPASWGRGGFSLIHGQAVKQVH